MKKLSTDFKMWLATIFISIPLCEVLMYFLMQCHDAKTGKLIIAPERETLMWAMGFFLVVVTTILLGLMSMAQKEQENSRKKTGEAEPFYEKDFDTGIVVAFGNVVKIYHGSQRVSITLNTFNELAKEINEAKKKADCTITVKVS